MIKFTFLAFCPVKRTLIFAFWNVCRKGHCQDWLKRSIRGMIQRKEWIIIFLSVRRFSPQERGKRNKGKKEMIFVSEHLSEVYFSFFLRKTSKFSQNENPVLTIIYSFSRGMKNSNKQGYHSISIHSFLSSF